VPPIAQNIEEYNYISANNPKIICDYVSTISNLPSFKIHTYQFSGVDTYDFLLSNPGNKIILLSRLSRIRQYVSSLIAHQTDIWNNADTSHISCYVDLEKFANYCNQIDYIDNMLENKLKLYNCIPLRLFYEHHLYNTDTIYDTVASWANEFNTNLTVNTSVKKQMFKEQSKNIPLSELIINYNEIKDDYRFTQYT
jgi:hypothetical protein